MDNLTLARKGDKDAFLKLIQNVKTKLYKTGMAILKNDDDVCDALQETLINAYYCIIKSRHGELEKNYFI